MTAFGWPHLHLRLTDSTNERARERAVAGAPSGTIVTAAEQSAGRGRRGRAWSAPAGAALLYSAILRPLGPEHALLPLAVPVAVCEAIESCAARTCAIKWPNDVWIVGPPVEPAGAVRAGPDGARAGRKVAGALIEARPPEWAVIGIGVNVAIAEDAFPPDLRWPATSIGDGVTVADARQALCKSLGRWVAAPAGEVLAAFRARDVLAGRALAWDGAGGHRGVGVGAGVDERGHLLVDADSGERLALGAGEVSLRLD